MAFDLRWSAARREDKPQLTIPVLADLNDPNCQKLVNRELSECAQIIKSRGLLYRWKKYTGPPVLVVWNPVTKIFVGFDSGLFCRFLGEHFDLSDKTGMSFGAPHAATAARLWETLVSDATDLPWADWALTDQWRRAANE